MQYNTGIAYLLWLIGGCGTLGIHRFYLGKIPTGLLWVCTGGLGFMGSLYDLFTLPSQVREANIRASYRAALDMRPREPLLRSDLYAGEPQPRIRESIEKVILRVAKKNGGLVSPGEVALESDYSTDDARNALEKLAAKGLAEMRIRQSGVIVYRFPEFSTEDQGFEPGL